MAKVGYSSDMAYVPNLGFQEGWFEIIDAKTQVYQFNPSKETGEQLPPFLGAVLMFQRTNEQGVPLDEEPQEKVLRIEKDLSKMRPGMAKNRDDDDPSDMGDELLTEGNCIFTEEGAKININSAWMVFAKSLENRGFKAEILGQGFLPDLIGTRGHALQEKTEKRKIEGRDVEISYLVVDKLTVKPYEPKAAKKPAGAAAKAAAPKVETAKAGAVKPNGAVKPAAAPAAEAEAEMIATALIAELSQDLKGKTRDRAKFFAMCFSRLIKDDSRDKKLDKEVQALLRNDDWLAAQAETLGFSYESGVFSFPEAA